MTAILNCLSFRLQYSMTLSLSFGGLSFLCVCVILCCYGFSWCSVSCSSAGTFEVADTFLL